MEHTQPENNIQLDYHTQTYDNSHIVVLGQLALLSQASISSQPEIETPQEIKVTKIDKIQNIGHDEPKQTESINIETIDSLINFVINKRIKSLKICDLCNVAEELELSSKIDKKNKKKELLINEIIDSINNLSTSHRVNIIKKYKIGLELEVKTILDNNISIDSLIASNICLKLSVLMEENQYFRELFVNVCDLQIVNDNVKSSNCIPLEVQGLYILSIGKNNIDYVVKLGSFAESQGMFKRICSFGGGNYETGSATNKWFQRFIKKAIAEGYTSKFTYFNKKQEKIMIVDLDGNQTDMMPYVMRPLESQMFQKYNKTNNNIPPIFGSNCL